MGYYKSLVLRPNVPLCLPICKSKALQEIIDQDHLFGGKCSFFFSYLHRSDGPLGHIKLNSPFLIIPLLFRTFILKSRVCFVAMQQSPMMKHCFQTQTCFGSCD